MMDTLPYYRYYRYTQTLFLFYILTSQDAEQHLKIKFNQALPEYQLKRKQFIYIYMKLIPFNLTFLLQVDFGLLINLSVQTKPWQQVIPTLTVKTNILRQTLSIIIPSQTCFCPFKIMGNQPCYISYFFYFRYFLRDTDASLRA